MKELWHGYLSLGIIHPMIYPACLKGEGPILETISTIALDSFFGTIEVRRPLDSAMLPKMRKILDISGLRVGIAGQPPLLVSKLNLNSENEEERQKALNDVKLSIDAGVALCAEKVVVLSGPCPENTKKAAAKKLLISSLKELAQYAKQKGLIFSLETFDDTVDKKCLIGPSEEAAELAAEIRKDFPGFGLCLDLSHLPLLNEKSADALGSTKKYLNHIHVGTAFVADKTSPAFGDQHPRFNLPGSMNSSKDLAEFVRILFKIGYLPSSPVANPPAVSFEVKPLPEEAPELVIANTKRVWKEAWALV